MLLYSWQLAEQIVIHSVSES